MKSKQRNKLNKEQAKAIVERAAKLTQDAMNAGKAEEPYDTPAVAISTIDQVLAGIRFRNAEHRDVVYIRISALLETHTVEQSHRSNERIRSIERSHSDQIQFLQDALEMEQRRHLADLMRLSYRENHDSNEETNSLRRYPNKTTRVEV